MNVNQHTVSGRLARDRQYFAAGEKAAAVLFTMIVNSGVNDKEGNEATYSIDVRLMGKTAERLEKYLMKGKEVLITGRPTLSSYKREDGSVTPKMEMTVFDLTLGNDPKTKSESDPV